MNDMNSMSAEDWNDRLRGMLLEQKESYETQLTTLREKVEALRHAETIETLRDPQVAGWVCPSCFTRLYCHCKNCYKRNKDKTPYLWKPDGMHEYCSVCKFSWFADMSYDIEYHRMKFITERAEAPTGVIK